MNAKEMKALYNKNWVQDFVNMPNLYARIRVLSENGAYQTHVAIDSQREYDKVKILLQEAGFATEDYNGGKDNILEVSWQFRSLF